MRNWRLFFTALSCAALSAIDPAIAASPIGNTVQTSTTVSASGRVLEKSSPVFFNDILRSNATGIGQFIFNDGGRLAIGPSATVTIDKSIYKGGKSVQQASIQASKGAFRFISGAFSVKKINTPYGTIGIRGTAFDFTIRNGRVYILLFRGAVSFCRGGNCKTLRSSCDYLVAGGGKISDPQALSAGIDQGLNIGEVFPLVVNQSKLNSQFRQGTRNCFSRAAQRTPNKSISPAVNAAAAAAAPDTPDTPDTPGPPGSPGGPPGNSGKSNKGFGNGGEADDSGPNESHNPGKGHGGPHSDGGKSKGKDK
ncbi:FecR family protein [Aestuariivirga sp. YIM B02566]|uniref:FecR domain-containing protein n=1 Tax=Taklimakanibacter albus TaxID=2800327 RepID=A0ACC5REP3_9HYPH|nr:FecR domain-containing protein [Aestuariivirga sp. YIM B02566]MBK1870878.1 FecR domain-containing protein [Aestuariivirga sp. YIM B02566]